MHTRARANKVRQIQFDQTWMRDIVEQKKTIGNLVLIWQAWLSLWEALVCSKINVIDHKNIVQSKVSHDFPI